MTEARELSDRARDHQELVGRTVGGKYSITRLIGRGGMGAVYEGENLAIGRKVALKFVDREWAKDDTVASRFAREARAASSIDSEHIVSIFDAGTDGGRPYLVMELLRGEDLGKRLRRERRIPVEDALHVAAQVLRGLAFAHHAGIIHRDLKPDNIFLVERSQDPLFAKIVDFGVSKIARAKHGTTPLALTQKGIVLGTPWYMSPEQAQAFSDVDGRADLYSLGAILFECLTGRPPHTGETYEQVIVAICMTDAQRVSAIAPEVPDSVSDFIARALARKRDDRFQDAAEMLDALRVLAPNDASARPLGDLGPPPARDTSIDPGPPTDVSWTHETNHETSGAKTAEAMSRVQPKRAGAPRALVFAIAALATVTGLGVTLWIVSLTQGSAAPDTLPSVSAPGPSSATPSPPPTAPSAQTTATPSATDTAPPPATSASAGRNVPKPAPRASATQAQPPSDDLDIVRHLKKP